MSFISRRSLDIRSRMRRRSVSILVSPGPRIPTPPPLPPAPPPCRDIDSPQPRSLGSMYSICASVTCALPSRLVACWAKMSRISAVRSMTLTLTAFSSALSCAGSARRRRSRCLHRWPARLHATPAPYPSRCRSTIRLVAALDEAFEHLRTGGLGERGEFSHACIDVGGAALGPHAHQHDAFQPKLAVLDLGDVGKFGRQTGHTAQCRAVFEGSSPALGSRLTGKSGDS